MPNMLIEGVVQIVPKVGMAMRLYLLMHIDAHQMRIIRINRIK